MFWGFFCLLMCHFGAFNAKEVRSCYCAQMRAMETCLGKLAPLGRRFHLFSRCLHLTLVYLPLPPPRLCPLLIEDFPEMTGHFYEMVFAMVLWCVLARDKKYWQVWDQPRWPSKEPKRRAVRTYIAVALSSLFLLSTITWNFIVAKHLIILITLMNTWSVIFYLNWENERQIIWFIKNLILFYETNVKFILSSFI